MSDLREAIQSLVREATRPDRMYPIRGEKHYGHYAGHLPDGRQALVTFGHPRCACVYLFDRDGRYLGLERRWPVLVAPPEEIADFINHRELLEYLAGEFGFVPGLIRVGRFSEPAEVVSIEPLPDYLGEFIADPDGMPEDERLDYFEQLGRWVAEGAFVLNTWNDYWIDKDGEVESS